MTRHCKIIVHILYFLQSGAHGLFHRKMANLLYEIEKLPKASSLDSIGVKLEN